MKMWLCSKIVGALSLVAAGGYTCYSHFTQGPKLLINQISPNGQYRLQVTEQPTVSLDTPSRLIVLLVNTRNESLVEATNIPRSSLERSVPVFAEWSNDSRKVTISGFVARPELVFHAPKQP